MKPAATATSRIGLVVCRSMRARAFEPDLHVMLARARPQVAREQALELARRQSDCRGDLLHRPRLVAGRLHHVDRGDEPLVGHAEPALDGHPLRIARVADARMDELLRHVVGKRAAVALADQLQHHVERRRAAGARVAVAVDGEDVGGRADARIPLGEGRQALPVQRRCAARRAARRRPARTRPRLIPPIAAPLRAAARAATWQPRRLADVGVVRPGAHEQQVERRGIADRALHGDVDAVARPHGLAVARIQAPCVEASRRSGGWRRAAARSRPRRPSSGTRGRGRSPRERPAPARGGTCLFATCGDGTPSPCASRHNAGHRRRGPAHLQARHDGDASSLMALWRSMRFSRSRPTALAVGGAAGAWLLPGQERLGRRMAESVASLTVLSTSGRDADTPESDIRQISTHDAEIFHSIGALRPLALRSLLRRCPRDSAITHCRFRYCPSNPFRGYFADAGYTGEILSACGQNRFDCAVLVQQTRGANRSDRRQSLQNVQLDPSFGFGPVTGSRYWP